jgi:hypothetical protein
MLRMCVYMHSRFVQNHSIWILEDELLIFEVVLSHSSRGETKCIWVASCSKFSDTVLFQAYCFSFSAWLMLLCSSIEGRTENY